MIMPRILATNPSIVTPTGGLVDRALTEVMRVAILRGLPMRRAPQAWAAEVSTFSNINFVADAGVGDFPGSVDALFSFKCMSNHEECQETEENEIVGHDV